VRPRSLPLDAYRLAGRGRAKLFTLLVRRGFAEFGAGSAVHPPFLVYGEDRIAIGRDVVVHPGCWLQVIGEQARGEGRLAIGEGCSIGRRALITVAESVVIGRKVLLAPNVVLQDHVHGYDDVTTPVIDQPIARTAPIEIGDGAWLGQNVVVGPGVRIGRGAVVGANAVVRSDVPDHSLAVGAPARVSRRF